MSPEMPIENNTFEDPLKKERLENLSKLFDEAEKTLTEKGRDEAKPYLPKVYDEIISLNKRSKEEYKTLFVYNSEGSLSEEELNAFNLRRKKLSNAIGIINNGTVRHDLYPDVM